MKQAEMPIPYNMKYCSKAFLDNGHIALRPSNASNPTTLYNSQFEPLKTYSGYYGHLIGALGTDQLVYKSPEHNLKIYSIDQDHQLVMTLQPFQGESWSDEYLSICRDASSKYIAVYHEQNQALDIYDSEGM